jgi:hypothetical protein
MSPDVSEELQLLFDAVEAEPGHGLRRELVDDGPQARQARHDASGELEERARNLSGVGIEVEAVELEPTRHVHLPDPLGRKLGEELVHRLPPVALVDPDVVQVE